MTSEDFIAKVILQAEQDIRKYCGIAYKLIPLRQKTRTDDERIEIAIHVCAAECGITVDAIKSGSRKDKIVNCRKHLAFYLYNYLKLSLKQIGVIMGGRDHTTILNLLNKFEEHMEYEPEFEQTWNTIHNLIKQLTDENKNTEASCTSAIPGRANA